MHHTGVQLRHHSSVEHVTDLKSRTALDNLPQTMQPNLRGRLPSHYLNVHRSPICFTSFNTKVKDEENYKRLCTSTCVYKNYNIFRPLMKDV